MSYEAKWARNIKRAEDTEEALELILNRLIEMSRTQERHKDYANESRRRIEKLERGGKIEATDAELIRELSAENRRLREENRVLRMERLKQAGGAPR